MRVQSQRQSQSLAELRRETGLLANVRKQTDLLSRSTGGLETQLGGLATQLAASGFASLATEVTQFATDSIRASVKVEGFRNSLTALYGDAQIANAVLEDLRDLAQLPGITFEGAVKGAIRLKTVGVEGDRALNTIREFGNAAGLAGASSDELGRSLVGFTQILSRGKVSQEELNQILENVPLIGNSIREAFGSIDAEVIRDQLDAAGQSVQDFADILVNQLAMGARASADSAANAFSNLGNAVFELQADLGSQFLPVIQQATVGLTAFLDAIRTNDLDALPEPIQAIVAGAQSLYDGFIRVAAAIKSGLGPEINLLLPAIGNLLGDVLSLAGSLVNALAPAYEILAVPTRVAIALIVELANTIGDVIEGITSFVNWVTGAADAQEGLRTSTQATAQVMTQTATATQTASTATQQFQGTLGDLQTNLANTRTRLDEKRQALQDLVDRGVNMAHPAVQQLNRQIGALESQLPMATAEVDKLKQGFLAVETPTKDAEIATRGFITSIDNFGGSLTQVDTRFLTFRERTEALSGAIRELPSEISAVRGEFDVLAPTVVRVQAVFDNLNTSLVDTQAETQAMAIRYTVNSKHNLHRSRQIKLSRLPNSNS